MAIRQRRQARALLPMGLVLILLGLGEASCAEERTIDGARLEDRLRQDFAATDLTATGIECPKNRPARQGDRFSCVATLEGGARLVYDVEQTNERGEYQYRLAPDQIINGDDIAAVVAADISSGSPGLADATVTCPKTVVSPGGRAVFECAMTGAGSAATIVVTQDGGHAPEWTFKR
jgi:hypothetical protein